MQKENKELEYKESLSKTYLETVSAFANYNDGEIIFGVTSNLKVIGIDNSSSMCLNIENQINDSINPQPDYSLKINDNKTISLFIKKKDNILHIGIMAKLIKEMIHQQLRLMK